MTIGFARCGCCGFRYQGFMPPHGRAYGLSPSSLTIPEPTLHEYIAKVKRLLPQHPLTDDEKDWASLSRQGGIKASRFAGWLALSASSPLLPSPLPAAEKTNPLPVREPEGGGIYKERNA